MAAKAKVVLTDYVWESLDVEKKILEGLAELVPLQTKMALPRLPTRIASAESPPSGCRGTRPAMRAARTGSAP